MLLPRADGGCNFTTHFAPSLCLGAPVDLTTREEHINNARAFIFVPDEFHISPQFVRRDLSIHSGKPLPSEIEYINYGPEVELHTVHVLETEVIGTPVIQKIKTWHVFFQRRPRSMQCNITPRCVWAATTYPKTAAPTGCTQYIHNIFIIASFAPSRLYTPSLVCGTAGWWKLSRSILRILLATIRNLEKPPCPGCYILKEDIPDRETVRDGKKREALARTDEHVRDGTTNRIRNWIFKFHRNVKSTMFDYLFLARSWTRTSAIRKLHLAQETPENYPVAGKMNLKCVDLSSSDGMTCKRGWEGVRAPVKLNGGDGDEVLIGETVSRHSGTGGV
ncbi:hypothetical protein B0H11DRAFT_2375684 [Mycena galericulata]|nr:hypothetical protein B0H11DRAFT_2375684 [Mycena galericulata]